MNYISMVPFSTSDYKGISVVLAVSGCSHKCDGCWAKATGGWKHTTGLPFNQKAYTDLLQMAKRGYIDNIVIQGGDPLYERNVKDVLVLLSSLKRDLPKKRIVLFSGYTIEQIQACTERSEVLHLIDVLIDGKFEKSLSENPPPWRGSSNQRVIKLKWGEEV